MPGGLIWSLFVVTLWAFTGPVDCQARELINTFLVNLRQQHERNNPKGSQSSEFSPPQTSKSTYKWVAGAFGLCYGCGRNSYKAVTHDCVHRLPMQLNIGNFSKTLMGVFKVADSECVKKLNISPAPVNVLGCGPACSDLRLLRGPDTGCRCDRERKLAYNVPKLVCQDNRNRTVSLSLCSFFYERNPIEYQAASCDYPTVCSSRTSWLAGNWTQCSHENSIHQSREVVCVVEAPDNKGVYYSMHESMCASEEKPKKLQLCARWTAERNFLCKCSTRRAYRRVLCIRKGEIGRRKEDEAECGWHAKPQVDRPCTESQLKACGFGPGGR